MLWIGAIFGALFGWIGILVAALFWATLAIFKLLWAVTLFAAKLILGVSVLTARATAYPFNWASQRTSSSGPATRARKAKDIPAGLRLSREEPPTPSPPSPKRKH